MSPAERINARAVVVMLKQKLARAVATSANLNPPVHIRRVAKAIYLDSESFARVLNAADPGTLDAKFVDGGVATYQYMGVPMYRLAPTQEMHIEVRWEFE